MTFVRFLASGTFLKHLALAVIALGILSFGGLVWLDVITHHGHFEIVPDLKGESVDVAKMQLSDNKMIIAVQEASTFDPHYPKRAVIEQNPRAGTKVKEGRKVYVTLNLSEYTTVEVPDLQERTLRQAKFSLSALGLQIGSLTYVDNIAKNVVLEMQYEGKVIHPGIALKKTSTIDLVLGNGKRPSYEEKDTLR